MEVFTKQCLKITIEITEKKKQRKCWPISVEISKKIPKGIDKQDYLGLSKKFFKKNLAVRILAQNIEAIYEWIAKTNVEEIYGGVLKQFLKKININTFLKKFPKLLTNKFTKNYQRNL